MDDQEYMETHPILFKEAPFEAQRKKALCKDDVPIIPKARRIIVIRNEFIQRSMIYIPDTAQVKPTTGVVVAIGPDVEDDFVRLDEMVVFSLYAGVQLNIIDAKGKVTPYLSLTPDEIAAELIVDPERISV